MKTSSRAALAALLLAASSIALADAAMAQREYSDPVAGGRAGRPAGAASTAKPAAGPALSAAVGRALGEAQKLVGEKKWPEALTAVKTAQTAAASDYEKLKVNQFMMVVAFNMGDEAAATAAAEAAADLPAASIPDEDKLSVYRSAAQLALNAKHNDKAFGYAKQLIAINAADAGSKQAINTAYYMAAPPAEAVAFFSKEIDAAIAAGQKPTRDVIDMKINAQIKSNDTAGAERTMEQALAYYNDPKDWDQMFNVAISTPGIRDIDAVMVGRLLFASGLTVSKDNADLIGQTAQRLGLYGDAAFAATKGGTGFNNDQKRIADDKATMPQQIAEGQKQNGIYNVKLAEALYGYGMYAQAETAARLAMTKGGIDNSEAQMLIAMSLYQQGKYAEAEAAFGQVQGGGPATARIARLWAIQSKLKASPATASANP